MAEQFCTSRVLMGKFVAVVMIIPMTVITHELLQFNGTEDTTIVACEKTKYMHTLFCFYFTSCCDNYIHRWEKAEENCHKQTEQSLTKRLPSFGERDL